MRIAFAIVALSAAMNSSQAVQLEAPGKRMVMIDQSKSCFGGGGGGGMVGQGVTAAITGALGRAFGVDFATMLKAGSPGGSAAQIDSQAAAQTGTSAE